MGKFTFPLWTYIVVSSLLFQSCDLQKGAVQSSTSAALSRNEMCLFKAHGSNTIGAKLLPSLVHGYFQQSGMDSIKTVYTLNDEEKRVYGQRHDSLFYVEIFTYGSSTGFSDLLSGDCDLAMSSKPISAKQIAAMESIGPMTSPQCQHIIGLDGIAILVNRHNPIDQIDLQKIRNIFNGVTTNWSKVTNRYSGSIHLYTRDEKSGTYEVFNTLVMNSTALHFSRTVCTDNEDLSEKVSQDPFGIGYASLTLAENIKMLSIKSSGSSVSIPASEFSVLTDEYPLVRSLYLYTPPISITSMQVQHFVKYIKSNLGQKVVEENHFIAQTPKLSKINTISSYPDSYKKAVQDALRISISIHFQSGKIETDEYLQQNIDRLVTFIRDMNVNNAELIIIGFSDGVGTPDINQYLSLRRAFFIQTLINAQLPDIATSIAGFGDAVPITSDATPLDRQKNRRVEVWIRLPKKLN